MYVNIKHDINWWDGGIEIDDIIRGFTKRLEMKESNYSKYTPCYLYLQYDNVTVSQFRKIKQRLKNSKRLQNIDLKIVANDVL